MDERAVGKRDKNFLPLNPTINLYLTPFCSKSSDYPGLHDFFPRNTPHFPYSKMHTACKGVIWASFESAFGE